MKLLTALVLASCPTGILADCPTGKDSAAGLTMIRNTPFFGVTNTLLDDHVVREQRLTNRDGDIENITAYYKFGFIVFRRESDETTLELNYSSDFSAIEPMTTGTVWNANAELLKDGNVIGDARVTVWIEGTEALTIGECTYEAIRIRDTIRIHGGDPINFSRLFSPELGVVLDAISMDVDWNPISQVSYDQIFAGAEF